MDTNPTPEAIAPAQHPWLRAYPPGVAWDIALPPDETLVSVIDGAVARFGPKPCMDFLGRRCTYAELGAQVDRAAEGLRRLDVRPGSRVGICLPNTPFFVVAYFAALKAGAIVVNYSPLHVEEELAAQAADSGTEVMLALDLDPILPRVLGVLDRPDSPLRRVVVCRFARALPRMKGLAFRIAKRRSIAAVPRGDDRVVEFDALLAAPPIAAPPPIAPSAPAVLQ